MVGQRSFWPQKGRRASIAISILAMGFFMSITADDIQKIHTASLQILDEIGIRFLNKEALAILKEYGCRVEGDVVRFAPEDVMELVGAAPSHFTLEAKNPRYASTIGQDNMEFLAGYGAPSIMDYEGACRPAETTDYINFLKLVEVHDHFNINGGVLVQPRTLPADQATALMLAATLHHSTKGLLVANANGAELQLVLDVLEKWFGEGFEAKPHSMTLINSLSPLQYDEHALENCIQYARRGQALVITGGALIGATGPLSLAASFAQANAETLAGIAFSQIVRRGTPVVYGMMSSVSDMATGTACIGCPEKALATLWNGKLGAFYNLPCRAGGTDNDAQAVNVQSGMEAMFTMGATFQANTNLVIHAAGILAGYAAMSYEKFITDLDALSMLQVLKNGINVNGETLAMHVMKEVGIGKEYLTHPHTFAHCRDTIWPPKVGVRRAVSEKDAHDELKKRIDRELKVIYGKYSGPEMENEALQDIRGVLKKGGVDYEAFFPIER